MRICSLLPSATEIVFALGLGESVVGVTHECDYPPEAKAKPVLVNSLIEPEKLTSAEIDRRVAAALRAEKSFYAIDPVRLREAEPDLILTQELCEVCALDYGDVVEAARALPRMPKILALNPTLIEHILLDIERVGEATGKKREAGRLVKRLARRIERVRDRASRSDARPRVACLEWLEPIYTAGHWMPELVEIAGGRDGLATQGQPSARIAWNKVVKLAPEVIVLMPCGFNLERTVEESSRLSRLPGWRELPAVQRGRVFAVNGHAHFNRPGPRLVDGLEILAQIIHPQIFPRTATTTDVRPIRDA